jgi:hypothetical protein
LEESHTTPKETRKSKSEIKNAHACSQFRFLLLSLFYIAGLFSLYFNIFIPRFHSLDWSIRLNPAAAKEKERGKEKTTRNQSSKKHRNFYQLSFFFSGGNCAHIS